MEEVQTTQASARDHAVDSKGSNVEYRGSAGSNTIMDMNRDQYLQQDVRREEEVDSARRGRLDVELEDDVMREDGLNPGAGSVVASQVTESGNQSLGGRMGSSLETMGSSTPVNQHGWEVGLPDDFVNVDKSGSSKIDFFAIDAALENEPQCTPTPLSTGLRGREHKTTPFPQSDGCQNSVAGSAAAKPLSSWCENNIIHEGDEDSGEGLSTPLNQGWKPLTPVPATIPVHNSLQFHGPSGVLSSDGSLTTNHAPLDDWSPSCPSTVVVDSPASTALAAPSAIGQEHHTPSHTTGPLRQSMRR